MRSPAAESNMFVWIDPDQCTGAGLCVAIFSFENDPFADVNKEAGILGLTECNNNNSS